MWTHTQSNRVLPLDKAFSLNNVSYPSNWLRVSGPEDKAAIGLEWIVPEPPPVVRAPIERLRADGIARAKDTAGKMLAQSDWMVIANVERSRLIAGEWAEYRAAVITEADRLEGKYNAAATYTDLDLIRENWPLDPNAQAELDRMKAEEEGQKDVGV